MEVKMTAEGMYTIKEAAKKVHVEAHALRYWEEELGLSISRNDQGYRQYSEEDMELLERIRQWKEKGMQLKAIRLMLSENGRLSVPQEIVREAQSMLEKGDAGAAAAQQEHAQCAFTSDNSDTLHSQHALTPGGADTVENILLDERSSKAAKLQYLLENLVSRAVQESNEMVLKELDYRFRQMEENAQEREQKRMEREEEHYRKLDELLCQKGRRKGRRIRRIVSGLCARRRSTDRSLCGFKQTKRPGAGSGNEKSMYHRQKHFDRSASLFKYLHDTGADGRRTRRAGSDAD